MADDDKDILAAYLTGVTPLARQPGARHGVKPAARLTPTGKPGPAAVSISRSPAAATPGKPGWTPTPRPVADAGAGSASLTAQVTRLELALDAAQREIASARADSAASVVGARAAGTTAEDAAITFRAQVRTAQADATLAQSELVAARTSVAALTAQLADVETHRRSLQQQLSAEPKARPNALLRTLLDRRGLVGDDEHALAIRALFDARREKVLLDLLAAVDAPAVEAYLAMHVRLVAEGEEVPPGVASVRVPPERSESPRSAANARAIRMFNDACLVHGYKRVVVVGGSPAARRVLKEGVDPRIRVTYVEGDDHSPSKPAADLVIVWASSELDHATASHFPDAIIAPHRSISRMLEFVVERLKAR